MPARPAAIIDPAMGIRFKQVREFLKFSQEQMAELCKCSQGMIARIEKGEREISAAIFQTLFIKKNISPIFIIAGGIDMEHISKKTENLKITATREMQADIEMLKGEIAKLKTRMC